MSMMTEKFVEKHEPAVATVKKLCVSNIIV